jgi:hypothetical protein
MGCALFRAFDGFVAGSGRTQPFRIYDAGPPAVHGFCRLYVSMKSWVLGLVANSVGRALPLKS